MSVLIKNGRRYGGAGTMTYTELSDKPSINNVTLSGNKTAADLGLFSGDYDDLTDKPTLGTAAALDVAVSGDAGNDEVVLGNDSRLSDAREASDVYSWAKASTKPDYEADEINYDNTDSSLTATNVQDAIDEIVGSMGGGTAEDITYDNTTSSLTADDVQEAIDELNTKKANGEGLSFSVVNGILCVTVKPDLVAFNTATDAQIADMIEGYYDGLITLSEIQSVWHVGDKRSMSLSAIEATGVSESHAAQTVEVAIIDFNHDTLSTTEGGKTKAVVTLQQVDSLNEKGYINSTATTVGGWTSSARRTWCNEVYYNALPSTFKSLVKAVDKTTSEGNQSKTINTDSDKVFLLSEKEVSNSDAQTVAGEGTKYPYYTTTAANRIKKVNGSASKWWLRSPSSSLPENFVYISATGGGGSVGASERYGLAPAFCF